MPSIEGFLRVHHSIIIHAMAPAHAARWVARMAIEARGVADSAEPPLKPNQPTHKRPVPTAAMVRS